MENINFITNQLTSLRYFVPLTIEANKRNIKSRYFIHPSNKYNCPVSSSDKNWAHLIECSNLYNFELVAADTANQFSGVFFMIEDTSLEFINNNHKKYSLTYMRDFVGNYDKYIDSVDHVIMPSKFMAEYYKKVSQKNLYLGSPKYDISYNNREIYKKYNISTDKKKALVFLPRKRDLITMIEEGKKPRQMFEKIYKCLRSLDFEIITKTRAKDKYDKDHPNCGDYYFEDESWFPHSSLELICISDLIINFSSSVIKECVLSNKPIINFHIKPFKKPFSFLYDYDYCIELGNFTGWGDYDIRKFKEAVNFLLKTDLTNSFNKSIEKHLFTGNSSKRILDKICE